MMSPLMTWVEGERNIQGAPPLKYDSTLCSSEDSLNIHKPHLKTSMHIQCPDALRNHGGPSTVSEEDSIKSLPNKENICPPDECSSVVIFNTQPKRIILSETDGKGVIQKVFECFNDPYGKLPFPSTPKPLPPVLLSPTTRPCDLQDRYIAKETRTALKKAAIRGEQDFKRVLKSNGIDPVYLSSKKKSAKNVNFGCNTPIGFMTSENCETPSEKSSLIDTPVSGVKLLISERSFSENSPFTVVCSATSSPTTLFSDTSVNGYFSEKELPFEKKSTLLSGIVCFVDCRSENENRTESVQAELLSLGARVEKNFTKKVTHVVFKEGKISTYIKAKKENIPLVGVLWIEACKRVQGIADPALYRPKNMQRYDRLLPYQMIKKRRLAILNPNSRVRKNLMLLCGDTPPPSAEKKRKSSYLKPATDSKVLHSKNEVHKHPCSKELFKDEGTRMAGDSCEGVLVIDSSNNDNSAELKDAAGKRRKSAPGKLISRKTAKRKDIKAYFKKIETAERKPLSPVNINDSHNEDANERQYANSIKRKFQIDDEPPLRNSDILLTQDKKKRKLFDPNESIELDPKSDTDSKSIELPYMDTPKRARTKVTCGARPLKVTIARKLLGNIKKKEEIDDDSSPSSLWFTSTPYSQSSKYHESPSITFTSIPRSDLLMYANMVKKLGKYTIDEKVTNKTTHIVSNGPRRTINLIKGIARGCWLVDIKWVVESAACGKWLSPKEYDLSSAFPAAAESCKVRRSLKTTRVMDVFKGVGNIYVSRKLKGSPHFSDLEELLLLCAATVVHSSREADIVIGKKKKESSHAVFVSAKWVLDCITQNSLLSLQDFIENESSSQGA